MEQYREYGEQVRVVRPLRNDGTYPGMDRGELLVPRGSVGVVIGRGTFLQDQVIYTVNFLDAGRVVGCRQEELIDADAHWVPTRYEFRDKVTPAIPLGINGEAVVAPGTVGEVCKVLRDLPDGVAYHVNFDGRVLQVPEKALTDPSEEYPS
ncbi:nitrogen fixation protein NifZ [Ectothiorhodospira lacustris]|uniref:nitrogen fixation protein NifZ n=1 Tax=Ectothiorhodospira lacustris TaxID=2899127 RepID=UPI001EE8A8DF|nr:nitrogen fixation protein NifZ [Ectothiorhodospira lacustris]MCG5501966.1 nitrogen fixation protein NifZ [Ectothiorhodospira lacustris]MCG5510460.1 nitrogen fixation protein NifZ [Ectothiorhodospira lacustris]MCG5522206.1 nitrogen fixation protein NifZ [Ectothiorhodospira lacustris]